MSVKPNVFITGANGLVGRVLVARLSEYCNVHAAVRTIPQIRKEGVQYHLIDFAKDWDDGVLPPDLDIVFHLAQSENFRDFPNQAIDIFKVNIDSTARLLDFAQKTNVKRFVYASSGGVYGAGNHAFHENSPITSHGKLGYYLGSKLCSEVLVENYSPYMLVNIARFFFVYGAEQKRSMLIPRLVDSVKEGRPIQLQGKDGIFINPIHVSDAVRALEKMTGLNESATFNIAGSEIVSLREIADLVGAMINKTPVYQMVDGESQNIIANIELMKSDLCIPSVSLSNGLKDII
ncbi:NAD-dependent epimerase/dehydratase family protein [Micavibrio aeruginosavorus]|uniref:NAD dependent epimerase/dehydratase family protein n=1 Tax=Micavibrio aeruginosavorus (strain ARL-13) TaxID=856793 RepID=G2KLX2_MICAA|nr:NAD(P)-dependent oxidoreductase [Micavibrio aeruginosavorus]AEP09351.1 NAD dependent epimerase/dehydratase family protein [Micavibrio aeruginosavorus ARL-13]